MDDSFEDSERFEEDESLCTTSDHDPESSNHWRGWKKDSNPNCWPSNPSKPCGEKLSSQVLPLVEIAAKEVACHIPFEIVEHFFPPIPDELQLRIAFWSFPESEEDVRLYSCLANSSDTEFTKGEAFVKQGSVKDLLQIGFHLSATIIESQSSNSHKGSYNVAVTFDRRRITTCNCTCNSSASWCSHIVAVCLFRIYQPHQVCLRAPVSESLSRLGRDELQKFAQYLISELPQQILPTAQRLLDDLLSKQNTDINTFSGAPDPTAGASVNEQTSWWLDESQLHENIRKILVKLCVPMPIVFSDPNYLQQTLPPVAVEWASWLRPLRAREPEGMWNLLAIVLELIKRGDRNAVPLLKILTEEVLSTTQIVVWWFQTKVSLLSGHSGHNNRNSFQSNTHASQHACTSICDEIVSLWRLACLNPGLSPSDRDNFHKQLRDWHISTLEKVWKTKLANSNNNGNNVLHNTHKKSDYDNFPGFKPAMEACLLDWEDYPIPGITYSKDPACFWYCPCPHFHKWRESSNGERVLNNSSLANRLTSASVDNKSESLNTNKTNRSLDISNQRPPSTHSKTLSTTISPLPPPLPPPSPPLPTSLLSTSKSTPELASSSSSISSKPLNNSIPSTSSNVSVINSVSTSKTVDRENNSSTNIELKKHESNRSSFSSEGFCETSETEHNDSDFGDIVPEGESFVSLLYCKNQTIAGNSESSQLSCKDKSPPSPSSSPSLPLTSTTSSPPPLTSTVTSTITSTPATSITPTTSTTSTAAATITPSTTAAVTTSSTTTTTTTKLVANSRQNKQTTPETTSSDSSDNIKSGSDGTNLEVKTNGVDSSPSQLQACQSDIVNNSSIKNKEADKGKVMSASSNKQSGKNTEAGQSHISNLKSSIFSTTTINLGEDQLKITIKAMTDPSEILLARTEALHAHGFTKEACLLAVQLAEEMLNNPPNLLIELPNPPTKSKKSRRFSPAGHQISMLASATMSKAAFLCQVLSENEAHHNFAFKIGVFGLELARPPASTKALEVKLFHQEQELVTLLKKIPLREPEMDILRVKAEVLRQGEYRARGEAVLPIALANYIFDTLVYSASPWSQDPSTTSSSSSQTPQPCVILSGRKPGDEILGLEASIVALGMKANVSEAEHPLLCEGTRKQRGDFIVELLVHYRDNIDKLNKIMDKVLDREVHQMYKNPPAGSCGSIGGSPCETASPNAATTKGGFEVSSTSILTDEGEPSHARKGRVNDIGDENGPSGSNSAANFARPGVDLSKRPRNVSQDRRNSEGERSEGAASPGWDESFKAWEARFRCINLRSNKKHSVGMASIDSSAPETTSSDNSPTVVRRSLWIRPGSDSGSSGESSDSFASSSSGDKALKNKITAATGRDHSPRVVTITNGMKACSIAEGSKAARLLMFHGNNAPIPLMLNPSNCSNVTPVEKMCIPASQLLQLNNSGASIATSSQPIKTSRYKGRRMYPTVPNQPSEASSYFMHELAKTILEKAGGSSNSAVLFSQQSVNQNHQTPHRNLHMCALKIALYSLGLHNAVSPNWLSRTYSHTVSWITNQAVEIGAQAINFLIDTWEGHLTPTEAATLADRASGCNDQATKKAASKLALSCLPQAQALNPSEIQRAIIQCKEHSDELLEEACLAVELAAKGGGVCPEVLFYVARRWYELYEACSQDSSERRSSGSNNRDHRNRPPFVQASIGEFQVPSSNSSSHHSQSYNNNDFQGINSISQDPNHTCGSSNDFINSNSNGNDNLVNIRNSNGQMVSIPQGSLQMIHQPMPCPPPPYSLSPANTPYSYGFFPGVPAFSPGPALPFHPAFIQTTGSSTSYHHQYPSTAYFAATPPPTSTANVMRVADIFPELRNSMPPPHAPTSIFAGQPLLPNMMIPQMSQRIPIIPVTGVSGAPLMFPATMFPPQHNGHFIHQHQALSLAHQPQLHTHQQLSQKQFNYLLSAYRVAILAMEALARKNHDERPQTKYARNPTYEDDVKWLFEVVKKLGASYFQDFCICTINSITSPFVLLDIVTAAAKYLSQSIAPPINTYRSPLLTPLIQKCQQMFVQGINAKLNNVGFKCETDTEDFLHLVRAARQSYALTQGGLSHFEAVLHAIKNSRNCKKELWQLLNSTLQNPTNV